MKIIVNHCTRCPFISEYSSFYSNSKVLYCCLTRPKTEIISGEMPFKFDIPNWCPLRKEDVRISL